MKGISAGTALLVIAILFALLGMCLFAYGHDYSHPELKSWFTGLKNQNGSPCCDGDDATHVEDADWDTVCSNGKDCHYRVRLDDGEWYDVPDWAIVSGPNKSGKAGALVWPVQVGYNGERKYVIRCFMPGLGT